MSEKKGREGATSRAAGRKRAQSKEFTPLADAKQAILDFGAAHPRLTCAGAAIVVVACGALVVWFQCFSSYNAPAQFIYAGF